MIGRRLGPLPVTIGAVADQEVVMPRRELLGNFTTPGDTARITGVAQGAGLIVGQMRW
jgi:hypothetical protein